MPCSETREKESLKVQEETFATQSKILTYIVETIRDISAPPYEIQLFFLQNLRIVSITSRSLENLFAIEEQRWKKKTNKTSAMNNPFEIAVFWLLASQQTTAERKSLKKVEMEEKQRLMVDSFRQQRTTTH